MLAVTNKNDQDGKLADIVKGKDVFIDNTAPKMMKKEMVDAEEVLEEILNAEDGIVEDEEI